MTDRPKKRYTQTARIRDLQVDNAQLCREMSIAWKALTFIKLSKEPVSVALATAALDQLPKFGVGLSTTKATS